MSLLQILVCGDLDQRASYPSFHGFTETSMIVTECDVKTELNRWPKICHETGNSQILITRFLTCWIIRLTSRQQEKALQGLYISHLSWSKSSVIVIKYRLVTWAKGPCGDGDLKACQCCYLILTLNFMHVSCSTLFIGRRAQCFHCLEV